MKLFSTWHVQEFVFQIDPWKRKREVLSESSCQQVPGAGGHCETKQREEVNMSSNLGLELIFFNLVVGFYTSRISVLCPK